jgi:hypothetical protein
VVNPRSLTGTWWVHLFELRASFDQPADHGLFKLQISPALPVLAKLIYANDEEVLTDACWAISYLSDGSNEKIQAVIESGVCRRLVELLMWVLKNLFLRRLLRRN